MVDDEPSRDAVEGVAAACAAVGDRWSLPLMAALLADGPLRYGELQERLPAIAPNILSARLRALERDGLVAASRYSERPPRFDYRLTADGSELAGAIRLLAAWGAARGASGGSGLSRHDACGTELELRWWCPACGEIADAEEDETIAV